MFYYVARFAVSVVRDPPTANLVPGAPSYWNFMFESIVLFVVLVVVVSAVIATLLVVPYAFVVARRPEHRFWGEKAPVGRVMLWLAVCFIPLGIVLGAVSPPPRTTIEPETLPSSVVRPQPAPSRGR